MSISFNAKEIEILNGNDINKQKELVKLKVDEFNGPDIDDFMWVWTNARKNINKNQKNALKIFKRPKDDIDDEKKDNNNKQPSTMLLDWKLATTKTGDSYSGTGYGMCPKGDVHFSMFTNDMYTCTQCGSKESVVKCSDCVERDGVRCVYCAKCRESNLNKLKYQRKMDNIKREIIRDELSYKPSLSLDILCGLPRASALEKLMKDIMKLAPRERQRYAVFLIDMDNLKGLNSVLSHQGADEVIKNVGLVLQKWCTKVNEGAVKGLEQAYCFRQGGDEFCVAVKTKIESTAEQTPFGDFFYKWKHEINGLVKAPFMNKYKPTETELKEGIKTLKERKKKKIETALRGIKIDEKIKRTIFDAVNNMDIQFSLDKIGVSVGLFINHGIYTKERDWIGRAELAQDAAKDIKGKNSICIYWEGRGIAPTNRTEICLQNAILHQ